MEDLLEKTSVLVGQCLGCGKFSSSKSSILRPPRLWKRAFRFGSLGIRCSRYVNNVLNGQLSRQWKGDYGVVSWRSSNYGGTPSLLANRPALLLQRLEITTKVYLCEIFVAPDFQLCEYSLP
jgi:hypothetical protein